VVGSEVGWYDHNIAAGSGISLRRHAVSTIEDRYPPDPSAGTARGKQEKLDCWLTTHSTPKRFAFYIGRRLSNVLIQDVAKEHLLDWRTVKTLEMQYMREQIKRAGQPRPKVIWHCTMILDSERAKLTESL